MDFKKLIQVADVFGTETKKLAELKEGELADRIAQDLGWDKEDADEIEQSVDATGNDPAELADIMTDGPAQPVSDPDEQEPADSQDSPAITQPAQSTSPNTSAPEQPQEPAEEPAPQVNTTAPEAPAQTDAELDADSADNAPTAGPDDGTRAGQEPNAAPQTDAELDADSADNAPQGDALAGRLDTETPSLLDAYNDGGRRAMDNVRDLQTALSRLGFDPNGIDGKYGRGTYAAVQEFQRQNGLTVDGEAGPTTMAKLQELLNGGAAQEQPQGDSAADVAQDDAARTAPQTDAELDADSADNATPAQPAQTDAELDADSADNATPAQAPRVGDELGMQSNGRIVNFNVNQFKQNGTYIDVPDRNNPGFVNRVYGTRQALQQFIQNDRRGKDLTIQGGGATTGSDTRQAGTPDAERDGRERGIQTASKEFDMKKFIKESKELDECGPEMSMPRQEGNPVTMSVTLNASGEQNVQDLIRMMQLAGAKDAAPVADMHTGPVDKHDDMVNMMRMMDAPEESVEEEWDNAPEEEYKDHKHMTKDLSGGLNREKKAYKAAQPGDNAMAVESIKDVLIQALEEKYANDAQRMAVHAAKDEKKKKK